MHICYVTETYPPEINGVSLSVERTVRCLRQNGHALELIRPRQPHESPRDDGEEWRTSGMPLPMYPDLRCGLSWPGELERHFSRRRIDLVHVATPGPLGWAAATAARRLGLPLTIDFRTNFHSYSQHYGMGWLQTSVSAYLRRLHNRADLSFVPSRGVLRELTEAGFQRLALIGRGVDTDLFTPARRDPLLRLSWGVDDDSQRVLLYVGRLAREKNVTLALQAFEQARQRHPGICMIVVGDGPQRAQLERAFPHACFVGMQRGEALARHYASADIFLFPSESETFGNVTLEAMAAGLAVVAFNLAAVADHVRDGLNGLAVAPGDASAFLRQTEFCLAISSARLSTLRTLARQSALHVSWDAVLAAFEERLRHIATRPAPEPRHHALAT